MPTRIDVWDRQANVVIPMFAGDAADAIAHDPERYSLEIPTDSDPPDRPNRTRWRACFRARPQGSDTMSTATVTAKRPAAEPQTAAADKFSWKPMSSAPRGRLVLLKIHAGPNNVEIAVTGQYHPDYGGYATVPMGQWQPVVLYPQGWMDCPGIGRVDVVHGLDEMPPRGDT